MHAIVIGACALASVSPGAAGDGDIALRYDYGWPAGTVAEQLDRDPTLLDFGKGAIFVPSMTNPLDEPPVSVLRGSERVAQGTTGARLIVPPGEYTVRLGSGTTEQQLTVTVQVQELHTSVVPPTWAGLSVHVLDETFGSVRSSYELIRVDDREYFGVGFGADEQAGEPLSTWILEPGLYKIVRVGETYRARTDFGTVRLMSGQLTHFLLVVDEESGTFKGAGEVPAEDLFLVSRGDTWGLLIVGGDLSLTSRSNVLGSPDGKSYAFRAFVDAKVSMEILDNPLLLQLQVEEGQSQAPDAKWQKTQDRADLDGLYVYRLYPWLGPYVRFGAETNLLVGRQLFEPPTDVHVQDARGNLLRSLPAQNRFRLSPPFGLVSAKEGAGMNVRVLKTLFAETTLRMGVGARHRLTTSLYEQEGSGTAPAVFKRVPSTNQTGFEGTLVASLRLSRFIVASGEVDTLVPFENSDEVILEAEGTATIKLTSHFSINYVVRYVRDRSLQEEDLTEQDLLLRFSVELP